LTVREANHQAVLGGLVLVLVLADKALALTVIRLALAAAAEFDLVAREIRFALLDADEDLK